MLLSGGLGASGPDEDAAQKDAEGEAKVGAQPKQMKKKYYGVSACSDCHNKDKEVTATKALLYRGTEMHTWNEADKHKDATKNLLKKGGRGEAMAKILGFEKGVLDARCINCHGVYIDATTPIDKDSFGTPADRETSGVSCVVCHGPYTKWVNEHAQVIPSDDEGWRTYSPAEKQARGLNNLWDPLVRAELCCSCHVGNVKDGRLVTHEMYAAGHPPLPGFEIQTFSEAMPRHWEPLARKLERASKLPGRHDFYKKIGYFDPAQGDMEETRMLVISAVVAFRESVRLLHDQADNAVKNAGKSPHDGNWPEFAVYDCYACHHDLKADSWRQKRGYSGPPGRPQMRPWSTALVPLAIHQAGDAGKLAAFNQKVKALESALNKVPFGTPEDVVDSAADLLKWSDGLVADMRKAKFDEVTARKLLAKLVDRKPKEYLDFDSARQVGWGLRTILAELHPQSLKKKEVAEITDQLVLDLLKGQKEIVGDYLNASLMKLNAYNPDEFQTAMDALKNVVNVLPRDKQVQKPQ
jgi:hypothetical protein